MSNIREYKEIMAFHPGYYVGEIIEDMEISQAEFAIRLGTTAKTVSKLVNGQINLSNDLAKKLSSMLGTSVDLWLNLQQTYEKKVIEIEQEKELDKQAEIIKQIDYSYFVQLGVIPKVTSIKEKILNLCKYLKVADLRILSEKDFLVNFRTGISNVQEKNIINSRAWIQTAINESENIKTESFDAKKLESYLPELRGMTVQQPSEFYPRMKEIFTECGVAFVLLPHLKNSGVNGAVKWINPNRVVLAMNNRGLYADKFWFSLFHEIKHVLQQKIKTTFISDSSEQMMELDQALEKEADDFSMNYLIPTLEMSKFLENGKLSNQDIIEFAQHIGIHPGIVVGRLQHDGNLEQNKGSKLKEKYEIKLR